MNTVYHIFSDGIDEWVSTEAEARQVFEAWKEEGYSNIRLYKETCDEAEDIDEEEYIHGIGEFPY